MKHILRIAVLALLALSLPATADIRRGCKAIWEIQANGMTRDFGQFEARGSCRGKAYANNCRRAARTFAQQCFQDAWNNRWNDAIRSGQQKPSYCVGGRGNLGVFNYAVRDVKQDIERRACLLPIPRPFVVTVIGRTFDGKRCGGELVLSRTYRILDEMCHKLDR